MCMQHSFFDNLVSLTQAVLSTAGLHLPLLSVPITASLIGRGESGAAGQAS